MAPGGPTGASATPHGGLPRGGKSAVQCGMFGLGLMELGVIVAGLLLVAGGGALIGWLVVRGSDRGR